MLRSQIIEQRRGRAPNMPATAVSPGHSRVQAERHPARRPGALGISQAENAGSIPVVRSNTMQLVNVVCTIFVREPFNHTSPPAGRAGRRRTRSVPQRDWFVTAAADGVLCAFS